MKMHTMTSMLAIATVAGLSVSAAAQDSDQVTSVYERSRPDFQAPGARSGSFIFSPTVEVGGRFNSNIFARREPAEVDDFIWSVRPSFSLASDWNQNSLQFTAGADIAKYSDNGDEDYEDFNLGLNGRVDIERGMNFTYGAAYTDQHEDRGAPDTNGLQNELTRFKRFDANVGFLRDQSIMSLAVNANYENWDFNNPSIQLDPNNPNGPTVLDNTQRNRERYSADVRLGYEVDQYYEAFVSLSANRVEYDDSQATGGPQRNSDGWEARAGAAFDLTGTSRGEFFVGYLSQEYDSDSLGDIDDFTFGASLLWNPSGLTSVNIGVERSIQETIVLDRTSNGGFAFASGILATSYRFGVEHELQRNTLLKAGVSYATNSFENTVRDDDLYTANVGARYFINRNFSLNADYNWDYRNSSSAGQDFKRHVFMVGLTANW